MRIIISFLLVFCISINAFSQLAVSLTGGIATSSKINYATNKSMQVFSGRLLYATNHFQGGISAGFYMLNDPAYSSIFDIGLIASGRIPLSGDDDGLGSYLTAGGGIGYGSADFGKGMSFGLQFAYGYQISEYFAITAEIGPRYFNFTEDQSMFNDKWKGFANTTVDRFLIVPATIGIVISF